MCDIILAGDAAKFGQPEINLGVIPGAGGTQRLVRAVGKSKAMEMCLTGMQIDAHQAVKDGLASRVVPADELVDEAVRLGFEISSKGRMSVLMAKECVNAADEMTLREGLRFERRMFHSLFATKDQKEVSSNSSREWKNCSLSAPATVPVGKPRTLFSLAGRVLMLCVWSPSSDGTKGCALYAGPHSFARRSFIFPSILVHLLFPPENFSPHGSRFIVPCPLYVSSSIFRDLLLLLPALTNEKGNGRVSTKAQAELHPLLIL